MRAKETASGERSAGHSASIAARYDSECHQKALLAATPKDPTSERIERSCKLAPAVLRRTTQRKPD